MSAAQLETLKNRLETVIALARLLERVERQPTGVSPDQYRRLVQQLGVAMAQELPGETLQAVLGSHPAAAEVYENQHYAQSGLSRSSLERSVESEKLARQVIRRAARRA
ncbi:MAG TPA: hypothetical protein VNU71_08220 [Burkholderiaceae bacterium]|nr:hypothetical protein [Burkholderiaceae bacterium]